MSPPDDPHLSGGDAPVAVDGYEAFSRIGQGGFSTVYRARQTNLGREVAVKVLHADFSSPTDRKTFERECRAMGKLSRHPNIVTVYSDAFTGEGRPCIVMELYHGNCRERLEQAGPMPIAEAVALGVKISGALEAVHQSGVLHRDLKPHNIFISDYGEPALGDFGISTIEDERTVTGERGGLSVAYAAPEVLEDAVTSVSSDLYALAATIYHLVDGRAPFAAGQLRATVKRILTEPAPSLTRPDAPAELDHVLRKALAKSPADRYATAADFAEALRGVQLALGVDRTEIPLRRQAGVDGRDQVPAAPRVEGGPRRGDSGREPGAGEETVARMPLPGHEASVASAATPSASPSDDDGEPSRVRRVVAPLLAAAVIFVVLVVGVVAQSRGDDAPEATTPITVPNDDEPGEFFAIVNAPTGIAVTAGEDGMVEITFDVSDGAVSYEVQPVGGSVVRVSDGSPIATDIDVADEPCWVVRAFGEGGRVSRDSDPVCAG